MKKIIVKDKFSDILTNRNELQGDGKNTAIDFRKNFLKEYESEDAWRNGSEEIEFDFSGVKKISPSFANEAFAHFLKFTDLKKFSEKIKFSNTTKVQKMIIEQELKVAKEKRK